MEEWEAQMHKDENHWLILGPNNTPTQNTDMKKVKKKALKSQVHAK